MGIFNRLAPHHRRRARVLFVLLAEVIDVEFGGNANGAAFGGGWNFVDKSTYG